MFKRYIFVLLFALGSFAFAACSGGENNQVQTTTAQQSQATSPTMIPVSAVTPVSAIPRPKTPNYMQIYQEGVEFETQAQQYRENDEIGKSNYALVSALCNYAAAAEGREQAIPDVLRLINAVKNMREAAEIAAPAVLKVAKKYPDNESVRKALVVLYPAHASYVRKEEGFNPTLRYRLKDIYARNAAKEKQGQKEESTCGPHDFHIEPLIEMAKLLGNKSDERSFSTYMADACMNGWQCEDSVRFNPQKAYELYSTVGEVRGAQDAATAFANVRLQVYFRGKATGAWEDYAGGKAFQDDDLRIAKEWLAKASFSENAIEAHIFKFASECASYESGSNKQVAEQIYQWIARNKLNG